MQLSTFVHGMPAKIFDLAEGENLIGRQGTSNKEVQIDLTEYDKDLTISKEHALITKNGNSITIEDLGSVNGTYINNEVLDNGEKRELFAGDVILVGSVPLKLLN